MPKKSPRNSNHDSNVDSDVSIEETKKKKNECTSTSSTSTGTTKKTTTDNNNDDTSNKEFLANLFSGDLFQRQRDHFQQQDTQYCYQSPYSTLLNNQRNAHHNIPSIQTIAHQLSNRYPQSLLSPSNDNTTTSDTTPVPTVNPTGTPSNATNNSNATSTSKTTATNSTPTATPTDNTSRTTVNSTNNTSQQDVSTATIGNTTTIADQTQEDLDTTIYTATQESTNNFSTSDGINLDTDWDCSQVSFGQEGNTGINSIISTIPTTSRNASTRKKTPIRKGIRVWIKRVDMMQILIDQDQRNSVDPTLPNSARFYGSVIGGRSSKGWDVKWDKLPDNNNVVKAIKRRRLRTIEDGEEEKMFDEKYELEMMNIEEELSNKKSSKSLEIQSEDAFIKQDNVSDARVYECKYKRDKAPIVWRIRGQDDHITNDKKFDDLCQKLRETTVFNDDIDFEGKKIDEVFFDHLWPDMTGCAENIDKFHSDRRSPYYTTVKNEKIKFADHLGYSDDIGSSHTLLKQCILCVIAAATEVESGMSLWKAGQSGGRQQYPDFGKYVPENTMRAFIAAFPFMWVDEKYWFVEKRDMPWEMFMPVIERWNKQQQSIVKTFLCLIMDESMVGWRPKTSKLGGLPNYTWEPRKPIPLGTMFRNAAECIIGMVVHNDPCMVSELQCKKKYSDMTSFLFDNEVIPSHVAEVLRQVGNSGLERGGWCGGDAWFGSVQAVVSVKLIHGVDSTFIVKNNSTLFPMRPLRKMLQARYGQHIAGKWVVFETTVCGVRLIAMSYAWSMKGVSYFISSFGNTDPSPTLYKSNFEDDFGGVSFKMIPRPKLATFLYGYLPIIDEHNKQRQNLLNLEYKWPTKQCWVRLMISLVGFSVTNLYRLYRNYNYQKYKNMGVVAFSDLLCAALKTRNRNVSTLPSTLRQHNIAKDNLERVVNSQGSRSKKICAGSKRKGAVGCGIQLNCWVCRLYESSKNEGQREYKKTSWWCKHCQTPLCLSTNEDLIQSRGQSCVDQHFHSLDDSIRCNGVKKRRLAKNHPMI